MKKFSKNIKNLTLAISALTMISLVGCSIFTDPGELNMTANTMVSNELSESQTNKQTETTYTLAESTSSSTTIEHSTTPLVTKTSSKQTTVAPSTTVTESETQAPGTEVTTTVLESTTTVIKETEKIEPSTKLTTTLAPTTTVIKETENTKESTKATHSSQTTVQEVLASLSLEEKVAQLFILAPEKLSGEFYTFSENANNIYKQFPVGGFIIFGENLKSPTQLKQLNSDIYKSSIDRTGLPPILGIDEEGGLITRIARKPEFGVPNFDYMSNIGSTGNTNLARDAAFQIGSYLKPYHFNVNFAPAADVLSNPENTVLQGRSFGQNPVEVSQMVSAYVSGLRNSGLAACLKHFPGHGATAADTHKGMAVSYRTSEELYKIEIPPFRAGIDAGSEFVMIGHFSVPNYTGNDLPASLSPEIIKGLLRREMAYQGLVITDALAMQAIVSAYGSANAAVLAFNAGNDLLLMPENFKEAYSALLQSFRDGRSSVEQLNNSVSRIIQFKLTHGA